MVTILLATRITFLTLIENSVILDVLRITFLDEKSNSRCWYSPSKIDFYVVFSNFPKSFRVGWGWGRQCLTIAKQHVYTRMVHFSFCIEFQFVPFLYCQNGPKKQQSRNWQKINWMVQNAQFNSRFQYFWEILGVYIQVVWFPEELV